MNVGWLGLGDRPTPCTTHGDNREFRALIDKAKS